MSKYQVVKKQAILFQGTLFQCFNFLAENYGQNTIEELLTLEIQIKPVKK